MNKLWKDSFLHAIGGAALFTPMILQSPVATGFVWTLWGLLREQAQRHNPNLIGWRGFKRNWIEVWNPRKLIQGAAWGFGGYMVHMFMLAGWPT